MRKSPLSFYPMYLNIQGMRCVVIGGGPVAHRKVKTLLEYGAEVDVISPVINLELQELAQQGNICVFQRHYQNGDLKKARLVIAATNDRNINQQIMEEAKSAGILINITDNPVNSDFIVPSSFHRGDMRIAISTGGRSPSLSRRIRQKLEKEFGEEYANLIDIVEEVRTEVRRQKISVKASQWQEALDIDSLLPLLKEGKFQQAKELILTKLMPDGA